MKSKFTITKEDKKYMNSLSENLHRKIEKKNPFAEKYRASNKARHEALEKKKGTTEVGTGHSHYSGKNYKH